MNYNEIIGSNIRYERQKRGLTIEELSNCIGIGSGFLGLIERGYRGTSVANLCRIADFFEITLDQLIRKPLFSAEDCVNENDDVLESKKNTVNTILNSCDINELDMMITVAKALKKYTRKKDNLPEDEESDKDNGIKY
ncbi:MAG: helix-turn-helix transcriptional regulator [Firmicutes bacterium]|nr:helix-turn-helix transcriptional regulator [Bacillota bacterium]